MKMRVIEDGPYAWHLEPEDASVLFVPASEGYVFEWTMPTPDAALATSYSVMSGPSPRLTWRKRATLLGYRLERMGWAVRDYLSDLWDALRGQGRRADW